MERAFSTKFHLLNTQRSSQDIIWSSSDSSDCENVPKHVEFERNIVKVGPRKRKRSETKDIKRKNLSHLDIIFVDPGSEKISTKNNEEIPESTSKGSVSPIFNISQRFSRKTNASLSPILSSGIVRNSIKAEKTSPILPLQKFTPKYSVKVRKKLFNSNEQLNLGKEIITISDTTKNEIPLTSINVVNQNISSCNKKIQFINGISDLNSHDNNNQKIFENITNTTDSKINNTNADKKIKLDGGNNNRKVYSLGKELCNNFTPKTTNIKTKVEYFFNNNFNSQVLSQHSISEYESTPHNSSKTSEEIDIMSLTQEQSHSTEVVEDNSKYSEVADKSKKIKYKKDGLAFRLNSILKKQNVNISLWQHERFLALNSNFIMPAAEYKAFRIQNIQFKYGVYLLECKDVTDEIYFILINSSIANESQIKPNTILKLHEPFKIMTLENNFKLILNVSKYECKEIM